MIKQIFIYSFLYLLFIGYNYYNFLNRNIYYENNFIFKVFCNIFFINFKNNFINYDNWKIILITFTEYILIYKNIMIFNYDFVNNENYLYICWFLLLISSFSYKNKNILKTIFLILIFCINFKLIKYIYIFNYIFNIYKLYKKQKIIKFIFFFLDNVFNVEFLIDLYINSIIQKNISYTEIFSDIIKDLIGDYSKLIYNTYLYHYQYKFYFTKNFLLPTLNFSLLLIYKFFSEYS